MRQISRCCWRASLTIAFLDGFVPRTTCSGKFSIGVRIQKMSDVGNKNGSHLTSGMIFFSWESNRSDKRRSRLHRIFRHLQGDLLRSFLCLAMWTFIAPFCRQRAPDPCGKPRAMDNFGENYFVISFSLPERLRKRHTINVRIRKRHPAFLYE